MQIIAVSCILCRRKYKLKGLLHTNCVLLFICGVIGFLLTIVFSGTTAASYLACGYFKAGIESPEAFADHFRPVFTDKDVAVKLSVCVPTGNGSLV